jgi:hypothetical protein
MFASVVIPLRDLGARMQARDGPQSTASPLWRNVGGRVQRRFSFGQVIIGCLAVEAVLFPLYAIMPSYVWLGVVAGMYYFMSPIYNVVQFSYRLTLIPDRLQGRVNSTFRLLAFGFMPLGAVLCGAALERLGTTATVGLFSALLIALAVATALNPHVRHAAPIGHPPAI